MLNLKEFPEAYGRFHEQLQALHKLVDNDAPATEIGRAAALLYLDRISLILTYSDNFNATFGLEILTSYHGAEENLAQINTTIRIFGNLTDMLLKQIDGFLNCFGGTAVIGLQALEEWSVGNQDRQEYLLQFLPEVVRRSRRSRR